MLHAPKVTDETGEMKWHYETRISTELDVTFHVKPDHYGIATENALKRQILPVPFAAMKNIDNMERTWIRVTCVRSEIKIIAK
ncbi:Coat protein VP1/VP2 [Atta colombica]|uniref:Coat protein VP1/VP2 n=1 Tax=Atta colombica TaxID=520822 RepID=A0A151I4G5_9HYME|nr:Coat protein VP1/VP2 [Atta colombica]